MILDKLILDRIQNKYLQSIYYSIIGIYLILYFIYYT
jgi:hypothetical protein